MMEGSMDDDNESYLDTADTEPFEFYESLRANGTVTWDESLNGWLASSYAACRAVLFQDDRLYRQARMDFMPQGETAQVMGGARHINVLRGEDHKRMHKWWLSQFAREPLSRIRQAIIIPTINEMIDRFQDQGYTELVASVTREVPFRTILRVLGIPADSDDYVAGFRQALINVEAFNNFMVVGFDSAAAIAASNEVLSYLEPFIQDRMSGQGEDFISKLWRDGPSILDNWTIDDVRVNCKIAISAGTETTGSAMSNVLYLLASNSEIANAARGGDEKLRERLVEEAFRLFGPVHFRERRAMSDVELDGVPIKEGDLVLPVVASAGRDAGRYSCPAEFRLDREAPRDHMSFAAGPRVCAGSALARAELLDLVNIAIERLPGLRLNPELPAPAYRGFGRRAYAPLHVLFDA
jgi:cytochrome P450